MVFVAIPAMAFAQSYTSTLTLEYKLTGAMRNYSGANITIQTYGKSESCTAAKRPANDYFLVDLYRFNAWGPDDYIGRVKHSRYSDSKSTFSNVGTAKYYFSFQKSEDFCTVKGNVKMYN